MRLIDNQLIAADVGLVVTLSSVMVRRETGIGEGSSGIDSRELLSFLGLLQVEIVMLFVAVYQHELSVSTVRIILAVLP